MQRLIDACLGRSSALLMLLAMIMLFGIKAYQHIPKESNPDIPIPFVQIYISFPGISPADAERLLVRPLENGLRSIVGVKKMHANAGLGYGAVTLEFYPGFDSVRALSDVHEKVTEVKPKWPDGTKEPVVKEMNMSLFPVLNVIVHGEVAQRELLRVANSLQDKLEALPNILEVKLAGSLEEVVEIAVDPGVLVTYGINTQDLAGLIKTGNNIVAAGQLQRRDGSFALSLSSLLADRNAFLNFPVKVDSERVVKLQDIADVRFTYKDPTSIARVNGKPAVVLEITKRAGSNIIATIDAVKKVVEAEKGKWPQGIMVTFAQDQSTEIRNMLSDLENSILLAVILAMVPIVLTMGARSAFLVALAIPGSFMFAMVLLESCGYTLNIIVLFSLILCVGMVVDAAIVVCEFADRKIVGGMAPSEAYGFAAKRMCWPVIAGVATHVVVFIPLLFWPGIIGKFMYYMPITVIITMTGSLLMAFFFLPAIGKYLGAPKAANPEAIAAMHAAELDGDINQLGKLTKAYVGLLTHALKAPGRWVLSITGSMVVIIFIYAFIGPGKEFFPYVEPSDAILSVRAQGNISIWQRDQLLREVERRILDMQQEVRIFYGKAFTELQDNNVLPDTVAQVQLEFQDWRIKRQAKKIMATMRDRVQDLYGVNIEIEEKKGGPSNGKPLQIEISSRDLQLLDSSSRAVLQAVKARTNLLDVSSNLEVPEVEWSFQLDRILAARYGISPQVIGQHLQLFTNGLVVTTIRPDTSKEEVDVVVRFPEHKRSISELMQLQIATPKGNVALSNFVKMQAQQKQGNIARLNGQRVINIQANLKPGALVDAEVQAIKVWLVANPLDPSITLHFAGETEDQNESGAFLANAFGVALFMMALMMVVQFNSIYKMLIIMSAVFLSTGGVLLGLLVTYQPFGIVMCGIGIIALAGTIVNNNIIFIDTFDELRHSRLSLEEILLRTGAQRLRPILLTAGTGVLGLLPMVIGMSIDFLNQEVAIGSPSSQWWRQLSTTIAGGLAFATVLTLFYTPCLLLLGERWKGQIVTRFKRDGAL